MKGIIFLALFAALIGGMFSYISHLDKEQELKLRKWNDEAAEICKSHNLHLIYLDHEEGVARCADENHNMIVYQFRDTQ